MLLGTRRARGYGEPPAGSESSLLAEELRVKNVLELFLLGGISHYESFYAIESHGAQDNTGWHLHLASGELQTALDDCGLSGSPYAELESFDVDADGQDVKFGPFSAPLRMRTDIMDRVRLLVTSHEALPHEVAVPLSLTGRPLSSIHMAGLGTHVQRYFMQQQGNLQAPSSYVLMPSNDIARELGRAAFATGTHPAPARPLPLLIDQAQDLLALLERQALSDRQVAFDALVSANFDRYAARLSHPSAGLVRAPSLEDAQAAAAAVRNADQIASTLDPDLLIPVSATVCGTSTELDTTTMSLRLAAHLLTSTDTAKYVCVIDGGIVDTVDAGGYDTHQNNCPTQARNLTRAMEALASVIRGPDDGEDSGKIDLDETLIIVNTEFGRTPHGEGVGGRGHWPHSFPTLMIGGPVQERGIYGVTTPDSKASTFVTPAEHRIATMLALGIWPFEQDSYNVADVSATGATTEAASAATALTRVFGV